MTLLRLALDPRLPVDGPLSYIPLLPDETVVSWASRQPGVSLSSDSREERAFGRLTIELPEIPRDLRRQLQRAVQPPDDWLLQPHQRTLRCARCIAEDWAQGVPAYNRRGWCVAWRTCCASHGPLHDTDSRRIQPRWTDLLDGPQWTGQRLGIVLTRPHRVLLSFMLGADRRAIHLEAALAGRCRGSWFPKGMTSATLRATYQDIVSNLLVQMDLANDRQEEALPIARLSCAIVRNRFAINVLAEAILSVWTNTPLPASALALRTPLLVRAIGWGEARPRHARADRVLVSGPTERSCALVHYAKHLRAIDYARIPRPTERSNSGYLTLPEARLLGLPGTTVVGWLAMMTRQGQFQAFDARRGRLVQNRLLPDHARLEPETAPEGLILPAWAFRSPAPPLRIERDDLRYQIGQRSDQYDLRSASRLRRWNREQRKTVRFCPTARRYEVTSQWDESSPYDSDGRDI